MSSPLGVAVLGSTGSIGTQALDVVASKPDELRLVSLAAGSNSELLAEQIRAFRPAVASLQDTNRNHELAGLGAEVIPGNDGLIACATHPDVDIVVVATTGIASLGAVVAAITAGKTIALANKESLVCAADIILPLVHKHRVELRPVDSEHSAIWQCLGTRTRPDLKALTLTASGGPFRTWPSEDLASVTPDAALAHPTWSMGGKITVDSATLVNKGLEVIEAHYLFDIPYDAISVVIHPESIVHSLVTFADGSQLAQLSYPDMRLPIQLALTWPEHLPLESRPLDLAQLGALHFESPDLDRFPGLQACIDAGKAGGSYPAALSAADEVAVDAFLSSELRFIDIPYVLDRVLDAHVPIRIASLDDITEVDRVAREQARELIVRRR